MIQYNRIADHGDGEHVPSQIRIERQIEQIERRAEAEDRIVPSGSVGGQMAAAEVADYSPGVERRGGDHEGNGQQRERRKPAVSCVLAQAGSGESESTRMCDQSTANARAVAAASGPIA